MKIPQLKKKLEIKTCHNIDWEDNYSWIHQKDILEVLKDKSKLDPEVKKYLEDENAYTEHHLLDTKDIQKKLFNEIKGRIKLDDETLPYKDHTYEYWTKTTTKGKLAYLSSRSNYKTLIAAADTFRAAAVEQLNVWGVIEDETYASKIEQSFPQGTINWMGFLSTNELQKQLGKCRVLLNTPKWNEAYGNVIVEALACGVPVVAYKRGGPSEIIQHGQTGYLADPDDKKNMLYYVEIIEKIKRQKCRDWVEKNASSDIFANKVVNWLNKVMHEYK